MKRDSDAHCNHTTVGVKDTTTLLKAFSACNEQHNHGEGMQVRQPLEHCPSCRAKHASDHLHAEVEARTGAELHCVYHTKMIVHAFGVMDTALALHQRMVGGLQLQAEVRETDQYFNATGMCETIGKDWSTYLQLDDTKSFLTCLESDLEVPKTDLIETKRGGRPSRQGTWVHRRVAIHLAQWLSPEFACFVTGLVDHYLSQGQLLLEQEKHKQLQLQLDSAEALVKREEEARLRAEAEARNSVAEAAAQAALLKRWELEVEVEKQKEKNRQQYPSDWELKHVKWHKKLTDKDTFHLFKLFMQCGLYEVKHGGYCSKANLQRHFLDWIGLQKGSDIHSRGFCNGVEYCGGKYVQATAYYDNIQKCVGMQPKDFKLVRARSDM